MIRKSNTLDTSNFRVGNGCKKETQSWDFKQDDISLQELYFWLY